MTESIIGTEFTFAVAVFMCLVASLAISWIIRDIITDTGGKPE